MYRRACSGWWTGWPICPWPLELSPPRSPRAALLQLAGEMTLARGDLAGAAEAAAACRGALVGVGYRDEAHLPLARLEVGLCLARD